MFAKETGKVKTQKPERKILRKMKREYDEFGEEPRKSKIKKPKRGQKIFLIDDEEEYQQ